MDKKLTFALTLGLTAFMNAHDIDTLKAIKSPKTNKFFFTTDIGMSGKISEALSTKGNYKDCSVSLCTDPVAVAAASVANPTADIVAAAKPFYMLHLSNEDNVIFTETRVKA